MFILVARVSSVVGAIAWLIGLVLVSATLVIPSDATYFLSGVVGAILGGAIVLPVLVIAREAARPLRVLVVALGVIVCSALVVTSILLVLASNGSLGQRAPGWIPTAEGLALSALVVWILVASLASRRSKSLGVVVYRLGLITSISFLALAIVDATITSLDRGSVMTNAMDQVVFPISLLIWLCLPAWLVALAWRMRAADPDATRPRQPDLQAAPDGVR